MGNKWCYAYLATEKTVLNNNKEGMKKGKTV